MIRTLTPKQEAALIEKLAELEHEQWMNWSKALTIEIAGYLNWLPEDMRSELFARLTRWNGMWVPYDELSGKTKEQDRMWARKVLKRLTEFNIPTFITEQQTMEINEEEAETILSSLGDEDGEITEKELKLEKRIRKEFPVIDEDLKKSEHRDHLWEREVEDDKRVKEARKKLENPIPKRPKNYDAILNEFMTLKRKVLHELLEKEATDR